MAIKNLEKMDIYNPTNYVNNSEPDIDADNLNKTENKLEETVAKANEIIDALKTLISTVQTNSDNTVPSSSLAYVMQQAITKNKEDIATANSNLAGLITVIDATSPATTNQTVKVCSFPSGYTWNNSTLIAAIKQGDSYKYQNSNINTYLKIDGVYMYTADTNNLNCPCRVCLIKNNHLIP